MYIETFISHYFNLTRILSYMHFMIDVHVRIFTISNHDQILLYDAPSEIA